ETKYDRALRRARKLRLRLGGDPTDDEYPDKPPRMRWATYNRLMDRLVAADGVTDELAARLLDNVESAARALEGSGPRSIPQGKRRRTRALTHEVLKSPQMGEGETTDIRPRQPLRGGRRTGRRRPAVLSAACVARGGWRRRQRTA